MLRPLFYRLIEPGLTINKEDKEQYYETVLEDIQRILSTRYTGKIEKRKDIVNYGIPSIVEYSNDSSPEKDKLARYIKESIEEFEPRLRNVKVEFAEEKEVLSATCIVSANIEFNEEEERFHFSYSFS